MDEVVSEFRIYLKADGRADKTIRIYTEAARKLAACQDVEDWSSVTRSVVRSHMAYLHQNYSPAYARNQYSALRIFFAFLADEHGIPDPMTGMKPPAVPEKLVPVISDAEFRKLSAQCSGTDFRSVRDKAIIEFFRSSGARRAEVTGLRLIDIDLDNLCAIVTGKASRMRVVRFDATTALAISRYLRKRKHHKHADSDMLWLGQRGPMTCDGMNQMMQKRSEAAGVRINPHRFRHDFSHRWLLNGGQESDLMQQNGWSSPQMLRRYGASAAAERARKHYDRVMSR